MMAPPPHAAISTSQEQPPMAVAQPPAQLDLPREHGDRQQLCKFWRSGRCTRRPCKFLHSILAEADPETAEDYGVFDVTCSTWPPVARPSRSPARGGHVWKRPAPSRSPEMTRSVESVSSMDQSGLSDAHPKDGPLVPSRSSEMHRRVQSMDSSGSRDARLKEDPLETLRSSSKTPQRVQSIDPSGSRDAKEETPVPARSAETHRRVQSMDSSGLRDARPKEDPLETLRSSKTPQRVQSMDAKGETPVPPRSSETHRRVQSMDSSGLRDARPKEGPLETSRSSKTPQRVQSSIDPSGSRDAKEETPVPPRSAETHRRVESKDPSGSRDARPKEGPLKTSRSSKTPQRAQSIDPSGSRDAKEETLGLSRSPEAKRQSSRGDEAGLSRSPVECGSSSGPRLLSRSAETPQRTDEHTKEVPVKPPRPPDAGTPVAKQQSSSGGEAKVPRAPAKRGFSPVPPVPSRSAETHHRTDSHLKEGHLELSTPPPMPSRSSETLQKTDASQKKVPPETSRFPGGRPPVPKQQVRPGDEAKASRSSAKHEHATVTPSSKKPPKMGACQKKEPPQTRALTWKRQPRRDDEEEPSRPPAKRGCPRAESHAPPRSPKAPQSPPRLSEARQACHDLNTWCVSDSFGSVSLLKGHTKAVTGIAVPDGSDKVCSGSLDGTVRVWDCLTGKCLRVFTMEEGAVGCLISRGPYLLIGLQSSVKAFHIPTHRVLNLRGPNSLVRVLWAVDDGPQFAADDDEFLFAGTEDGTIYMWKMLHISISEVAMFTGHEAAVISLTQGSLGLFSGSLDGNIRVWDLKSFRCIHNFAGHTSPVTSLLCWDKYLLSSCQGDGTIKLWGTKGADCPELEVVHSHLEGQGVLAMKGGYDAQKKPVLMVSCSRDGTVRIYDLPSLRKRGLIYSHDEVLAIGFGPEGFVFVGDGSGEIKVVRWLPVAARRDKEKEKP